MNNPTEEQDPILRVAWTRYAEFDRASKKRGKEQMLFFRWTSIISVLAVLFAIIAQVYPKNLLPILIYAVKVVFVALPITASLLANIRNQFFSGSDGLILRAGAEQVMRAIYEYRTTMRDSEDRKDWMEFRMREIMRDIHRSLNGELPLVPYTGSVPPPYGNGNPRKDPGFHNLTADEYFEMRTRDQLEWHIGRRERLSKERLRLQIYIWLTGAAGSIFAFLGAFGTIQTIGLWVAFITATTTALVSWKELRNLDLTIRNYNKVALELGFVADHWRNLTAEKHTQEEFFKMVKDTESVLWNQNMEYIKSMQEALEASKQTQATLIDQATRESQQAFGNLEGVTPTTAPLDQSYPPSAPAPFYQPAPPSVAVTVQMQQESQPYQGILGAPDFNPMIGSLVPEGTFSNPADHLRSAMQGLVPEGSFDALPSASVTPASEGMFLPPESTQPRSGGVGD